ncbi:ATP-grasp fold amidoligase family protein [Limnobaculum parvum]|uniref:Glycosyltransferase n=1 Tax=Limnobaculum parvum TaxID=2172103 RepID=A0A2Y9TUM9_9GAMM|nr:ATP-grasp fold amidoligase family protein [Limnobaculum parvum]AWH87342.1 glycosyltransferase [Limnobaculum parvum]
MYKYKLKLLEYWVKKIRFYFLNDKRYRQRRFFEDFKRFPDLTSPKTFNEKIMYRMLYIKNSLFTQLADKVKAREYVKKIAGERYLVPFLDVYEHIDQLNFSELPDKFVLKCSHDCGSVIICLSKSQFDFNKAKQKITFCMKRNMYYSSREWQYRDITPRIMCEKYIDLFSGKDKETTPEVYQVHCFDGVPQYIEVDFKDIHEKTHINIYNVQWELQPVTVRHPNTEAEIIKPPLFDELLRLATLLTQNIDYCRIDFLMTDSEIYFSEFTFSPCNGRMKFSSDDWDYKFGRLWNLQSH